MNNSSFQSESSVNETPIIHFAGWQMPCFLMSRVFIEDGRLYFLAAKTHPLVLKQLCEDVQVVARQCGETILKYYGRLIYPPLFIA